MVGGILGALGGLSGGFAQGIQAGQNMQYRRALMALAQERVKAAQFQQQQAREQQQAVGLGYDAMLRGNAGAGSLFNALPATSAPEAQPQTAAVPPVGAPQSPPQPQPSAAPMQTADLGSLAPGTAPLPSPAPGGSPYRPPSPVGGMAAGGGVFQTAADADAQQAGIDPVFYRTLIGAESNWNPSAVNPIPVDGQHATGIAQFLPSTARQQGVDPRNPQQSLKGGADYFATLLRQNGGDYVKAAQAYGTIPKNLSAIHTPGQRAVLQAGMAATARHQVQTTIRIGQALGGAPAAQQAQPLSRQAVATIPQPAVTQMDPTALMRTVAQRINAAAPEGTPDNVKAMAWMQAMTMYSKISGPQMKMALDVWKANADYALRAEQIRAQQQNTQARLGLTAELGRGRLDIERGNQALMAQRNAAMAGTRGWQVLTDPTNNKAYRFNVGTGQAFDFQGKPYTPGGAARLANPTQAPMPPLKYPDKWPGMPDKPPPGVEEAPWDIALQFARTGQMPSLGFSAELRKPVLQAYPAALHALGMKPSQAPDVQAAFAGERHGEIIGGGRAANISLGIQEALKAAPQVIATSKEVPRFQFPAFNQFSNWLREKSGDPQIVAFKDAVNTYLNIYASVVSRTGQLTDAQQRHAYDLLSTNYNQGQIQRGVDQLNYEMNLMQEAVPPAMGEIQRIGQPPALQTPSTLAPTPQEVERRRAMGVTGGAAQQGTAPPAGGGTLPAQAQSQLKEGVDTTFGNGQVWTLQNGQPVRIR